MKTKSECTLIDVNSKIQTLEKELASLKGTQQQDIPVCVKEILKLPEVNQLKILSKFKQKWTMKVDVSVSCNFNANPFDDNFVDYGHVNVNLNMPKGYNLKNFLPDESVENADMDGKMHTISPEIGKQLKELSGTYKVFEKKAKEIVKKYKLIWDDVYDDLSDVINNR